MGKETPEDLFAIVTEKYAALGLCEDFQQPPAEYLLQRTATLRKYGLQSRTPFFIVLHN